MPEKVRFISLTQEELDKEEKIKILKFDLYRIILDLRELKVGRKEIEEEVEKDLDFLFGKVYRSALVGNFDEGWY